MMLDELIEQLAESDDASGAELLAGLNRGLVRPVLPGPGRENAGSLGATFAVRAKTSATAGIETAGLEAVVRQLRALPPETSILLFHFSGSARAFSVFVQEVDAEIVGVVVVNRTGRSD